MTVELCAHTCKSHGFIYAGLEAGNSCNCGNSFGRYGTADPSTCNKRCSGNREEMCGGLWRHDMYYLGE